LCEGREKGGREVRMVEMGCVKVKEMFWVEYGWVGRLLQEFVNTICNISE